MSTQKIKLLITGSTGFLGSIIKDTLSEYDIITLSRSNSIINIDLTKNIPIIPNCDIVVHAAGLAHLNPNSKNLSKNFYDVNKIGTSNLLEGLKINPPKTIVFLSTVAVYGIDEGKDISENDLPKPKSPYACSKYEAEILIQDWCKIYNTKFVILRLPLVVGKMAPGNLGSMIRAINKGYYIRVGNGNAKRSMVLAEDVAKFIPHLLNKSGIFNLTDDYNPTYSELDSFIAKKLGKKVKYMPYKLIKVLAKIGDLITFLPINTLRLKKLETSLTFSSEKAKREIGWNPHCVLNYNWI
jgi:nucleoside-diphosphate-sugar epimerase